MSSAVVYLSGAGCMFWEPDNSCLHGTNSSWSGTHQTAHPGGSHDVFLNKVVKIMYIKKIIEADIMGHIRAASDFSLKLEKNVFKLRKGLLC